MDKQKTCIVCGMVLQGNQRKFCSSGCKAKDYHIKTKCTNQNCVYKQHVKGTVRKLYFINHLGGCLCGYDKNISVLEFHHLDASTKSFSLDKRTLSNNNIDLIKSEVDKCILLCSNCHREIHNPELDMDVIKHDVEIDKQLVKDACVRNVDTYLNIRHCKIPTCGTCGCVISSNKAKLCVSCNRKGRRKVERPSKDVLQRDINSLSFIAIGRKYGVSDNAIRKWCKSYDIHKQ